MSKRPGGFTLIELMVVIAIIGVLTAVSMPNVAGIINKGKIAACQAEMNNIKTGILVYADDNGNIPPGSAWASWDIRNLGTALNRYMDRAPQTDPWKTAYYYNSCGAYYGWPYGGVVLSLGKNKTNDGSCRRCEWCCYSQGNLGGGQNMRLCGDDIRTIIKT